ncbi:hypothetical protein ABNQ38_14670 (plasmid) [Azospirillum sp. A29]|uniref:hypothetical protein n=1 Tax=Azospirillum sp. A29 TaxID=3160606 RepID=UPI00366CF806
MSGGISAIKGFDYQATVILDRIFGHFDQHGEEAEVRPEGDDDLDLTWMVGALKRRRYLQIKKPSEDQDGNPKPTVWTLLDVIAELLPNTIKRLSGNADEQVWILGNEVDPAVQALVDAGAHAPTALSGSYWKAVHGLARNEALIALKPKAEVRKKLLHWRAPAAPPIDPAHTPSLIADAFCGFAKSIGAEDIGRHYRTRSAHLHSCLPDVLARIRIEPTYGTEQDVRQRVYDRLEQQYALQRAVIEHTLFRNLRGFISDISKQPGRTFRQEEFEFELRSVWPTMNPVKEAPPLAAEHVARPNLTKRFTSRCSGRAIEAVGLSGSGKTKLAGEVAQRSRTTDPERFVYYAEVRPSVGLRDVLTGVAFHLRRTGISEPFSVSVNGHLAWEEILSRLARSFSGIPQAVLLLLDLVEGTCTDTFAHDLATFVCGLSSPVCRVAVFGQESALRTLSQLDRNAHGIGRLDIPGFRYEEFVALVARRHPKPDRSVLRDIYQRVTAGRAAGLPAGLAWSLARASSMEEMAEMAAGPIENMLAHADQRRFRRISDDARRTAEKLVCFALPFRHRDAAEIFPDDHVGLAIRELLEQGLLRSHDGDSFEMHETARAGLEDLVPPGIRRSTHRALATWYGAQGLAPEEIFHLKAAGETDQAQVRAREEFLHGKHWAALSSFVLGRKLVSADEVIGAWAGAEPVEYGWLLPRILAGLGEQAPADRLFQLLQQQPERFSDHRWASPIVEAILASDPSRLHDLIVHAAIAVRDPAARDSALAALTIGMLRRRVPVDSRTIDFFNWQPPETKRQLLRVLTLDRRRETLRHVFQFLVSDSEMMEQPGHARRRHLISLKIDSRDDAVEFLAALPSAKPSDMFLARSALLGSLENLVWEQRAALRTHAIDILQDGSMEGRILENAIRVLIFLAEPSVCALCDPLMTRTDTLAAFAKLVPALVPALYDRSRYEARLLDSNATPEDRASSLFVLASSGADLGEIYRKLKMIEADPQKLKFLEFWFLMLCVQSPFPDAIPLLEEALRSADGKSSLPLIGALASLGNLPLPAATDMLLGAVDHQDPQVRRCALIGLQARRSRAALRRLVDRYAREDSEEQAVGLATAIVASGPRSMSDLQGRLDLPVIQLWQCILAMRLRDVSMADRLVAIACDPARHWQVQRAAVFAAGRLPYEEAMTRIAPVVLAERSPLVIDRSWSLRCHASLSAILLDAAPIVTEYVTLGREGFIGFFKDLIEEYWKDALFTEDVPSGSEAAAWLFERLVEKGCPANPKAPDLILDELHVPMLHSAVLRSLRTSGRPDLIEEQLAAADHLWFATKCVKECFRAQGEDPELASRLTARVEASPCKGNARLHNVIADIDQRRAAPLRSRPDAFAQQDMSRPASYLSYDDAVRVLSDADAEFTAAPPLVLKSITAEQCELLIRLADPANDHSHGIETYVPGIRFTADGHEVAQLQLSYSGSSRSAGALIRPAIAAANRFGLPIPWHEEQMAGFLAETYVRDFLACLCAENDSNRFYDELALHEHVLFPYLCGQGMPLVSKYVDTRMIPFLARHVSSGTDELFEGLCALALRVNAPEIDTVLAGLLYRWTQRFQPRASASPNGDDISLWRGFRLLTEHLRFVRIKGWQPRLAAVLSAPMQWIHREDIVRVLERDPRSYLLIESRLFNATNWEHYPRDEIDRLDEASERLFHELLEE